MAGDHHIDHRDKQRLSLLDLPDDVLLLIISQVMETDSFHDLVQWTILLLVCKNMCQVGKRFPLQLQMSRDFYDKQAKCLETINVRLRSLTLSSGCKPMSSLIGSLPGLHRFAGTIQELSGLCLVRKPNAVLNRHGRTRRKHVACCDLSGFSALRTLSFNTDHRVDLRLPSKLTSLTIALGADFSELRVADSQVIKNTPRSGVYWMPDLFVGWAGLLRGATSLRTLYLEVTYEVLDVGPPRCKNRKSVRETPELYRLDLEEFRQKWPQGLHLRELAARDFYLPFDLAVRDAELVRFECFMTFVTSAASAEGVLDALLHGRVRKLCMITDPVLGPRWVGPALCGQKEVRAHDLKTAARSPRFASRVEVEEYIHYDVPFIRISTMVFTVTERWPEDDVAGCGGPLPDSWGRAYKGVFP